MTEPAPAGSTRVHTALTATLAVCGIVTLMAGLAISTGAFGPLDATRLFEWGPGLLGMAGLNQARPR